MGDVIEVHPGAVTTLEQKVDLGTLAEYNSENKYNASEWNDIAGGVSAMLRSQRLNALMVGRAPATTALTKQFVRLTAAVDAAGVRTVAVGSSNVLNRMFMSMMSHLKQGGSASGIASGSAFFGVIDGAFSDSSFSFASGVLLGLSSDGSIFTYAGGINPPIGIALAPTIVDIHIGGRWRAGNALTISVSGALGFATGANLSVGNLFVSGTLTVGEAALFQKALTASTRFITKENALAQITSDQDDFNVGETAFSRLFTDAERRIKGIANPEDGRHLWLVNIGSFNLVLSHEDAGNPTAVNRIHSVNGADIVLQPEELAHLIYDDTFMRWRAAGESNIFDAATGSSLVFGRDKGAGIDPAIIARAGGTIQEITKTFNQVITAALSVFDPGFGLPTGATVLNSSLRIRVSLVGAGGATAVSFGVLSAPTKYGETNGLAKNNLSTRDVGASPLPTPGEDIKGFSTDGSGVLIGTIASGTIKGSITYTKAQDLPAEP